MHNTQNHLLVTSSSASSPPKTTSIGVISYTSLVCSVGLRPVSSPGTVPDTYGNIKVGAGLLFLEQEDITIQKMTICS